MSSGFERVAYVLIDFDNYFTNQIDQLIPKKIELWFEDLILKLVKSNDSVDRVYFRLYGGWYSNSILTKRASELQQLISDINVFPYLDSENKRIVRGHINMVSSSLRTPKVQWGSLYHQRFGLPQLRINYDVVDEPCLTNKDKCPIFHLHRFTKSKGHLCNVSGCESKNSDVFVTREQKMVDTLIATDLIYCGSDDSTCIVLLISDDIDHFPAIIDSNTISSNTKQYNLLLTNQKVKSDFLQVLESNNIRIFDYES